MQIIKCEYSDVPNLNKFDLAYINRDPLLDKYILYPPDLNGIKLSIERRSQGFANRQLIAETIAKQNTSNTNPLVISSINALKDDNTFCVTTAHQPCLFGGPLYFVYKIACAINLAKQLNELYPEKHFVPVYYMGSEDHDFEEINNLKLFGKTILWDRTTSGPVGRLDNKGLQDVIDQILSNYENAPEKRERLSEILIASGSNYGTIIKNFVYKLFEEYPLIVIDPDDKDFKQLMIPLFKDELLNERSASLVEPTLKSIESDHFKVQAHGRPINLFYMKDGLRERIIKEDDNYKVFNTDIEFKIEEIINELNNNPDNFSPNVLLRPVYQESILPSVCFIGGGGEVAYWLELKNIFEYFKVPYPVIMRRNSALWIEPNIENRITKTGLEILDFIAPLKDVQNKYIEKNEGLFDLQDQKQTIKEVFKNISEKVKNTDASLTGKLSGDETQFLNKIDEWESRLNKSLKTKHETALNQIASIHEKLFPDHGLQERTDSFLSYYADYGSDYIKTLVDNLNPLISQFLIFKASQK